MTEVRQVFRSNVVWPAGARFTMSAACASGLRLATWMPGLPTAMFCRTTVLRAPAAMRMPLVLPVAWF